jgi:hypothetical protein
MSGTLPLGSAGVPVPVKIPRRLSDALQLNCAGLSRLFRTPPVYGALLSSAGCRLFFIWSAAAFPFLFGYRRVGRIRFLWGLNAGTPRTPVLFLWSARRLPPVWILPPPAVLPLSSAAFRALFKGCPSAMLY